MSLYDELQDWCDEYGFKLTDEDGEYIIWGIETVDEEPVEWLWYNPVTDIVQATDTDKNNMWLYESRPDLSADDIVEMIGRLAVILDWDDLVVEKMVDPEDWQEIAGVRDAYADERFATRVLDLV